MRRAEQLGLGEVFPVGSWRQHGTFQKPGPPRAESDIVHVDQRLGFMSCHRTSSRVASGVCVAWGVAQGWAGLAPEDVPALMLPCNAHKQTRRRRLRWGHEAEALSAGQPGLPRWAPSATAGIPPAGGRRSLPPTERRATQSHSRAPCGEAGPQDGRDAATAQGRQPPRRPAETTADPPQASRGGAALPAP